jgi:hypothetical protein
MVANIQGGDLLDKLHAAARHELGADQIGPQIQADVESRFTASQGAA